MWPISAIASQSVNPTKETMKQTQQLLDYITTQEDVIITYSISDMKLAVHRDESYLSEPKSRSRAGGHFFLSNKETILQNNGAILNIAQIIKHIMKSAMEAELAAPYIMEHESVYIIIILEEMGHKQPPNPLQTYNTMSDAVWNGKIQPKRKKQWTWAFIVLETENAKNNLEYIGDQENKTTQTTGLSTIKKHTTKTKDGNY